MMPSRCTAPSEKQRQREIIIPTHHYPHTPLISQWNRAHSQQNSRVAHVCLMIGCSQRCASTHRWSMNVNLPSMAQRVTNSAGLTCTSLGGWWEPSGRRRHTIIRQVRLDASLSLASASESSWLLNQLRMYPVQWRVQYLEESTATSTGSYWKVLKYYLVLTIFWFRQFCNTPISE